jgi:hypothetical protein
MAKRVRVDGLVEARALSGFPAGIAKRFGVHRAMGSMPAVAGKEPIAGFSPQPAPVLAQFVLTGNPTQSGVAQRKIHDSVSIAPITLVCHLSAPKSPAQLAADRSKLSMKAKLPPSGTAETCALFAVSVKLKASPMACPEKVRELIQGEVVIIAVPVRLKLLSNVRLSKWLRLSEAGSQLVERSTIASIQRTLG